MAKEKEEADKKMREEAEESSASSEEVEFTSEDIKKIKDLIKQQDDTIEQKDKEIKKMKKDQKELKDKLLRQMAENDNTVKRYRKQIEDGKLFAISKFAKEVLEVRDNLELALQHVDMNKVNEMEDISELKEYFEKIVDGQKMTTKVMDGILKRFQVIEFDPLGEAFDPNIHDAAFIIKQSDQENNTIGFVAQTGWKIGERILRSPKCGVVKKDEGI